MKQLLEIPLLENSSCELTVGGDCVPVLAVEKGSIHIQCDSIDGSLLCGQLVFLPPDIGACRLTARSDCRLLLVPLEGALAAQTLRGRFDTQALFCPDGLPALRAAAHVLKRDDSTPGTLSSAAYTLLMQLYEGAQPYAQTSGYPLLVSAAMGIMQEEFAQLYGVDEVAERLGVSPPHLTRVFSKAVGIPPGRFLRQQKINCAKQLLTQPDMTVSLTAQLVGFADVHYFSRVFRKETGLLPTAYRKAHAAAVASDDAAQQLLDTMYL